VQADLIPGYRIEKKLGHGAFAQVYLAVQRSLDREIALKVMNPQMATDKDLCERFIAEARVVASLRHRSIVSIHDVGKHEDNYYISMDLVSGSTLAEGIRRGNLLAPALTVIRQIAEALGCAHKRGIIHRDVKPGNILFDSDGTAILTDFGIAKNLASDEQLTMVGSIIGTAAYMSPEQVSARSDIDGRSDLYSLGIVLYEMLIGSPPFRGKDHFTTALMHLNQAVPQLPKEHRHHQALLDRMLAKERDDRFLSADDLVKFIDADATRRMTDEEQRSFDSFDDAPDQQRGPQRGRQQTPQQLPKQAPHQQTASTSAEQKSKRRRSSRSSRLSRMPIILGVCASAAAAVLALVFLSGGSGQGKPADAQKRQQNSTVSATPLDAATQKRVDNLMTAAQMHELVGRIADPPGANALEAYRDVLALDPGNAPALEALERLESQ